MRKQKDIANLFGWLNEITLYKTPIEDISEESWKHEVDDMAPRAEITDSQKDDLYKYILAMKASRSVTTN